MSEKNKKGLAGNDNVTGQTLPQAGNAPAIDVASFTGKDAKAVKFKVEYPDGYEGQKFMPDGELVEISTELAAHFTSINIGKIVE